MTNYGPLGVPWGALGCPGRFSRICRKLDAQFRANVSICTRQRIESSLPELARCARGADGARRNGVTGSCSDPPCHTRRSSWLVLVALGLALECLGLIWAPTWLPLTWPWAPWGLHGVSLGSLATPWTPFGVPWCFRCGSLRVPWGALGCPSRFSQICRKLDAQFRANVCICTRQRIESSLPELARFARGARLGPSDSKWNE